MFWGSDPVTAWICWELYIWHVLDYHIHCLACTLFNLGMDGFMHMSILCLFSANKIHRCPQVCQSTSSNDIKGCHRFCSCPACVPSVMPISRTELSHRSPANGPSPISCPEAAYISCAQQMASVAFKGLSLSVCSLGSTKWLQGLINN